MRRAAPARVAEFCQCAPESKVVPTARYDAAAALVASKQWPRAIQALEDYRRDYPKSEFANDVTRNLAVAYVEGGMPAQAAVEFERIAQRPGEEPGVVREARWPAGEGIRVDTHIASGTRISPYYDSLMAKIIAHAADRAAALSLLRHALASTRVTGVSTNVSFQERLLADAEFAAGGFDTGLVERALARHTAERQQVNHG